MIDYTQPHEFALERLWFSYNGQSFSGRGFMTWNASDGFRVNAFLDKHFAPLDPFTTLGKVIIETKEDTYTLKLLVHGIGYAIAPVVFPMAQRSFVANGQFSIKTERVIFFSPSAWNEESKTWSGSAIFLTKKDLEFPDSLQRKTEIGGKMIKAQNECGLRCEEDAGCKIIGHPLREGSFELSWSLSKERWTKTDAWNFREAARRALSIVFGQTIWIVRANAERRRSQIVELRTSQTVEALKYYTRPLVELDPPNERQFNKSIFVHLTKFFLSKDPHADVCWSTFLQMAEASRQKSWQSRELLIGTILEAVLRTLDNHPFKDGDHSWKIRDSLKSFRNNYLTEKWVVACDRALAVRDRLRHRNAHPDWLANPGGVMSKDDQAKSIEDLMFLSQFYGYIILSLARVKDLEPRFTVLPFHHRPADRPPAKS